MSGRPQLKKQKTVPIDKDEVDFRVLRFSCLDTSAFSALGKHCKETSWTVQVGTGKKVEIALLVDKTPGAHYEVAVECDGEQVFPGSEKRRVSMNMVNGAGPPKAHLKQDFLWRYPFRGTIKGIGKPKFFEVRPAHGGKGQWWPATVKEQTEDCAFRALVFTGDGEGGVKEVWYPHVQRENIRVMATKKPVAIPERALVLRVPAHDPLHACLAVDEELITHFFCRPTPPPTKQPLMGRDSRITLRVTKDRSEVAADVGFATFQHFLSGEIRAIRTSKNKAEHTWWLQVGPFAEHKVEVRKHDGDKKVFVLLVDDDVLVESAAEDIESREDFWECQFRLAGEKFLAWEVYETDIDGNQLDSKGYVAQKTKYAHELIVNFAVGSVANLGLARLSVDGVDFGNLPQAKTSGRDQPLRCSPEALRGTFNLMTPYKVTESKQDTFEMLRKALGGLFCASTGLGASPLAANGGLFGCCGRPPPEVGNMAHPPINAPSAMTPRARAPVSPHVRRPMPGR